MVAAVLISCFAVPGVSHGQLVVDLKLKKKTYVSHEAMNAEVHVYNRSGRDLVLGGPGGSSWLQFQVLDYDGNLISPGSRRVHEEPVILPSGGKILRSIDLAGFYPIYGYGIYRVRASVFFPPMDKFFDSRKVSVSVADGKKIWQEVAGPPPGFQGPQGYRRFALLSYRGRDNTELYVRVSDERTGAVYATYSLGPVILFHEPQAAIDEQGRLNVLYLGAPQTYAHSVVTFEGNFLRRDIYKAAGYSRPSLTMAQGGIVQVRGGRKHDEKKVEERRRSFPRLSDRPTIPGLSS